MRRDVGFAVPAIPPRLPVLHRRCLASVFAQTHPPEQVSVAVDWERRGAGPTRNRAKAAITTTWTCFVDDDDELYPWHAAALLDHVEETGADVVYPWFDVRAGGRTRDDLDPFPQWEHEPWDPAAPHIFPITALIRTELIQDRDFPAPLPGAQAGEDWPFWRSLNEAGAKISHLDRRTWAWHWDREYPNTSGSPSRW